MIKTFYMNVYSDGSAYVFPTREAADSFSGTREQCIEVPIEVPQPPYAKPESK